MLNKTHRHFLGACLSVLAMTAILSSCNLVKDDTDCVASYNIVTFEYSHNMKFADAFNSEVKYVSLLAFDSNTGLLTKRIDATKEQLGQSNQLPLELEPGSYDLLVWAGEHFKSFDIPEGETGVSTLAQFRCYMRRQSENGSAHVKDDLAPLFHGFAHLDLPYASPSKPNYVNIPLKKNTNVVRLVLQHISGDPVKDTDYTFSITDNNGHMEFDNSLLPDETITYHPWYTHSGSVDINTNPTDAPDNATSTMAIPTSRSAFSASRAEFTVGRLHLDNNPRLRAVHKESGKVVFDININDYALLVKGFYHTSISDQEYLDRQDEYNMTFFLDEGNRWFSSCIIINDWRIIRNNTPIQ